jgi:hypothetical protein
MEAKFTKPVIFKIVLQDLRVLEERVDAYSLEHGILCLWRVEGEFDGALNPSRLVLALPVQGIHHFYHEGFAAHA